MGTSLTLPSIQNGRVVFTSLRERMSLPGFREQEPEVLTRQQRNIAHQMSCTRKGCLRCQED